MTGSNRPYAYISSNEDQDIPENGYVTWQQITSQGSISLLDGAPSNTIVIGEAGDYKVDVYLTLMERVRLYLKLTVQR